MGSTSRRRLLGAGAAFTGAGLAGLATPAAASASRSPARTRRRARRPKKLVEGDLVRVVSPSSTPERERMAEGVAILEGFGLRVELAPHVYDKVSFLAGTDDDRIADLNDALSDPEVRAVIASRGGNGAPRIVDRMDFAAVSADPKPIVGYSDITILQAAMYAEAGVPSLHGPMVNWDAEQTGPAEAEAWRKAMMTTDPVVLSRDPEEETAAVEVRGRSRGVLLGGNLSLMAAAVGTSTFPDLEDAILLLEDVGETTPRIDRMLTQLRRSGVLDGLAGVAVGQFTDNEVEPGEWTSADILNDRLGDLGVPVLGGLRIGHGKGLLTAPVGTGAELDTRAGTLTIDPAVTD